MKESFWKLYEFDVQVMSNPWMYLPAMISALLYVVLMILKWWVLTIPIWVPISAITGRLLTFKYIVNDKSSDI